MKKKIENKKIRKNRKSEKLNTEKIESSINKRFNEQKIRNQKDDTIKKSLKKISFKQPQKTKSKRGKQTDE